MNTFTLIRRNLSRKRTRGVLLVLSIGIAFFIFALLAAFEQGFNGVHSKTERLIVTNKAGTAQGLPISYAARLTDMPEVGNVTYMAGCVPPTDHQIITSGPTRWSHVAMRGSSPISTTSPKAT
ncbi:hypothetical protein [Palleronia sp.]|uniref:hypothetical protein n=1 Tax=Palleronia sp. TaxID=1940284 RepID=UPI0035C7BAB5